MRAAIGIIPGENEVDRQAEAAMVLPAATLKGLSRGVEIRRHARIQASQRCQADIALPGEIGADPAKGSRAGGRNTTTMTMKGKTKTGGGRRISMIDTMTMMTGRTETVDNDKRMMKGRSIDRRKPHTGNDIDTMIPRDAEAVLILVSFTYLSMNLLSLTINDILLAMNPLQSYSNISTHHLLYLSQGILDQVALINKLLYSPVVPLGVCP